MTTHKENALELIAEARKRLQTAGTIAEVTISAVSLVVLRGLLEQAEAEVQQIDALKRPRRTRRTETAS